jgi:hypothetical protein
MAKLSVFSPPPPKKLITPNTTARPWDSIQTSSQTLSPPRSGMWVSYKISLLTLLENKVPEISLLNMSHIIPGLQTWVYALPADYLLFTQ